ncbi:p-loop containing nucleoside triphosphate hydrolase protein [Favolaschia claudopus]|uniref:DNA 3'-5' helicase n=1 Tax=Favolaschia claudopus TaxID=2862362 RepID=A0AAV9ZBZ1_9AGAR
MPFRPVVELDPIKLDNASKNLCSIFNVPSLHPYQIAAGQNIVKGISTFLDVRPTGGGKTLAFWYPLLYHWAPGNLETELQKNVLVVGPLTALIESQAADLSEKGIPSVAISSTSTDPDQLLLKLPRNHYRVALISPELAVSSKFHSTVLSSEIFTNNIISVVIDEAHCVSEWGNDDFRPEYSNLSVLLARIPSGVPVLAASATMPTDVIADIRKKLKLPADCAHKNIALSFTRVPLPSFWPFLDLMALFPDNSTGAGDFEQTLFYAESRVTAEHLQDFLRRNAPDEIAGEAFEFYHRYITEERKRIVQDGIESGRLRGVAATDALGMGMNFQRILRVILWLCPKSFLSLVQKIGRCARAAALLGEAILYITSSAYMQYKIELDILKGDLSEDEDGDEAQAEGHDASLAEGEQMDREAAVDRDEPQEQLAPKRKPKKAMTVLEARDRRYLLEFIVTTGCRRIPWNKFFGNTKTKYTLPYPVPLGARCCDNCTPDLFPVRTVRLSNGAPKLGRKPKNKTTEEVAAAVTETLQTLRDSIARKKYPQQNIITGKILMSDLILDTLAARARSIDSLDALNRTVRWVWAPEFGVEVVEAIQQRLLDFPDFERLAREEKEREKAFLALEAMAERDMRRKLTLVFDGCYEAILAETVQRGKKVVKRCQVFLSLPKKNVYPDYYELVKKPISMPHIRDFSRSELVSSTTGYASLWHQMFDNARFYNRPDSNIYEDAEYLQGILDHKLRALSILHNVPEPE